MASRSLAVKDGVRLCTANSLDAIWQDAISAHALPAEWTRGMSISSVQEHLKPLDRAEAPLLNVSAQILERGMQLRLPSARWHRSFESLVDSLRHPAPPTIKVAVIGASVAAGCGALSPSVRCEPQRSWARRLHDLMGHVLHSLRANARWQTGLWARGALGPESFTMCLGEKIGPDTNIVLFDFEPNLQQQPSVAAGAEALEELRQHAAVAAPNASLVFVAWPGTNAGVLPAAMVERAVAGMDVLSMERVMSGLNLSNQWARPGTPDRVHPSAAGHALIAEAVGRLLTRRLLDAICEPPPAALDAGRPPPPPPPPADASASANVSAAAQLEWCYHAERGIPVLGPLTGWAVRDEAGEKVLPKIGYVSTTPSSVLTLGPLAPEVACGLLRVNLGYLQSWRPSQGSLRLACWGSCSCLRLPGGWAKTFDFPDVHTFAPSINATITTMTSFFMLKRAGDCFLNVTHVARASSSSRDSHVRVDELSFAALDCAWTCFALHRKQSPSSRAMARAAHMCVHGAATLGLPGHLGPRCLAHVPISANATARCTEHGQGILHTLWRASSVRL